MITKTNEETVKEILQTADLPKSKEHIAKSLDSLVAIKNDYNRDLDKLNNLIEKDKKNLSLLAERNKLKFSIIYCESAIKALMTNLNNN